MIWGFGGTSWGDYMSQQYNLPYYQQQQAQGQQTVSPISGAISAQMPGAPGLTTPGYGMPGYGTTGYGQVMGMNPQYFSGLYAPAALQAQSYEQQQNAIAQALARAKTAMGEMGIPATGGLGDLTRWAEQKTALESQPIRRQREEALRTIEDVWARKGSALGSEYARNIAEAEGASLAAMRSSAIAAAIDAFMKRPQILAQLMGAMR